MKKKITIPVLGIKATFNQLAAFAIIILIIWALITHKDMDADVRASLKDVMLLCAGYIWGSSTGSHAKDEALAKSTPIPTVPDATVATTTTSTTSEK